MADFKQSYPKHKPFECGPYWHLRKSGLYLASYDLVGSVSGGGRTAFFASIKSVAAYFEADYETARRVFANLVKMGWLRREFDPKHQRNQFWYINHEDWAAKHPNKCAVRELLPWQVSVDPLVGKIYGILDGEIRLYEHHVIALRKFATDEEFLRTLTMEMAAVRDRRGRGDKLGTSSPSVFWRVFKFLKQKAQSPVGHTG